MPKGPSKKSQGTRASEDHSTYLRGSGDTGWLIKVSIRRRNAPLLGWDITKQIDGKVLRSEWKPGEKRALRVKVRWIEELIGLGYRVVLNPQIQARIERAKKVLDGSAERRVA